MHTFVIRTERKERVRNMEVMIGETNEVSIDYRPWADDNGTPSTVSVSVESGQASVGNESLTAGVKSMTITTANEGQSMLKVTATASNNVHVFYIYVYCVDPQAMADDYGICNR